MGFKKCKFHIPVFNYRTNIYTMTPDEYEEVSIKYRISMLSNIKKKKIKKKYPKWDSFYYLNFGDSIKIWIYLEKQNLIKDIWIEGEGIKNGVENIYNCNKHISKIDSKMDIIKLFPTNIQRDFIINSII